VFCGREIDADTTLAHSGVREDARVFVYHSDTTLLQRAAERTAPAAAMLRREIIVREVGREERRKMVAFSREAVLAEIVDEVQEGDRRNRAVSFVHKSGARARLCNCRKEVPMNGEVIAIVHGEGEGMPPEKEAALLWCCGNDASVETEGFDGYWDLDAATF
jgi:hypothetical protein